MYMYVHVHVHWYFYSLPLYSYLLSPSPDTVVRSCQFLCDVLLEDFPPEVFLQRPSILKVSYNTISNKHNMRIKMDYYV